MKTFLLYQLIFMSTLMVCKSYCTPSSTTEYEENLELQDGISSDKEDDIQNFDFTAFRYEPLFKDYPYHVAMIRDHDSSILCQGALIGSRWMLTSGICFNKYFKSIDDSILVVAGALDTRDTGAMKTRILRGIFHPKFNSTTAANDIVLLELVEDIANKLISEERRGFIDIIELSTYEYPPGTKCIYTSFEDQHLLYGYSLQLKKISDCDGEPNTTGQVLDYYCTGVGAKQFITNSTYEVHLTHIGTPLVCRGKLYGIKTQDGFFTATNRIRDWTESVISENQ